VSIRCITFWGIARPGQCHQFSGNPGKIKAIKQSKKAIKTMASNDMSAPSSKLNIEWQLLIELTANGGFDHERFLTDHLPFLAQKIGMPAGKCAQVLDSLRQTLMYAQPSTPEDTGSMQICFRIWIWPFVLETCSGTNSKAMNGSQTGRNSWGFFITSRNSPRFSSSASNLIELFLYREGNKL
jgi:hypothetical protein